MLKRARRLCLLASVLCLVAANAIAAEAITPQTNNERLMLEMMKSQQQEIQALKAQVKRLEKGAASATTGPETSAPKPGHAIPAARGGEAAGAADAGRIDAVEDKINELSKVMQTRVSQVEARTQDGKIAMTQPGPRIESASGDYSLQIVGAIQADASGAKQGDLAAATPRLRGGTNFRRAHFGVQGTAFRDFNYTLVYDAAATGGANTGIKDALVSYVGLRPFALTLGQQKPNVGMEPNFSDRSNASTFMEPGLSAAMITATGTRNIGARLSAGGEHYSASAGIFGEDASNNNVSTALSEGWGPAARVTFAPINSPGALVHVGASGYWRKVGRATGGSATNPNFQLRYRAQPEITVDSTRLIDTATMAYADTVGLFAAEAAGVYGPFSAQGEWAMSHIEQQHGRPGLDFDGGYAMASWFLTGESRVYDGRSGVFTRFSPKQNFSLSAGGWGAFEMALRWSYLDLNSDPNAWIDNTNIAGVRGGTEADYTLGLNWYLNPFLRVMFDYVHAHTDNFTIPATMGPGLDEGGDADIFAARLHQEW